MYHIQFGGAEFPVLHTEGVDLVFTYTLLNFFFNY